MTLVILPGVNSGTYLFEAAKAALKGIDVLAFDPPGVAAKRGAAPALAISLPFSAKSYARSVLRVLDERGIGRFDVLGHSMGGFAAQELAALVPHRVEHLVLVSSSAGQPGTTRDVAAMAGKLHKSYWEINQQIEHDPFEGMKAMFGKRYLTHEPHAYAGFIKARSAHLPGAAVSLAHLAAGGAFSSLRWVRRLAVPTLVIQGSDDVLVTPASGKELAGMLPQARYIELHGVGHFPMLEHPDFWRYVKDFLAGNGAGQTIVPTPANTIWNKLKEILTRHG